MNCGRRKLRSAITISSSRRSSRNHVLVVHRCKLQAVIVVVFGVVIIVVIAVVSSSSSSSYQKANVLYNRIDGILGDLQNLNSNQALFKKEGPRQQTMDRIQAGVVRTLEVYVDEQQYEKDIQRARGLLERVRRSLPTDQSPEDKSA